jgi:hypothetical protein
MRINDPTFCLGEKVVTKFEPTINVTILKPCAYVKKIKEEQDVKEALVDSNFDTMRIN